MSIMKGTAVVFGILPVLPIADIPKEALKVKVRLRAGKIAKAFVFYENRVEQRMIFPAGDWWMLGTVMGVNKWVRHLKSDGEPGHEPNPLQ